MMTPLKVTTIALLVMSALACTSEPTERRQQAATIGSLELTPEPLYRESVKPPTPEQLQQQYTAVLPRIDDPTLRRTIMNRIADLELIRSEKAHEQGSPIPANSDGYYDQAVETYQQLLAQYPDNEHSAEITYQLAKAYELQGEGEKSLALLDQLVEQHPDYTDIAEVQFRRGEILFAERKFASAIKAYAEVVKIGNDSPYFSTATYMQGWAEFKLERYPQSLQVFSTLLDYHLPEWIYSGEVKGAENLSQLRAGDKKLVDDTVRIMSLIFSYTDGANTIVNLFAQVGERHYEHTLYDALGQLYIDKDRYRDAADTYGMFVKAHPKNERAPIFAVKKIDAYILGDFPSLVLPEKTEYARQYGIDGPYWSTWSIAMRDSVSPYLHEYITQLAAYHHTYAQQQARLLDSASASQHVDGEYGEAISSLDEVDIDAFLEEEEQVTEYSVRRAFLDAGYWYQQFIRTFTTDRMIDSMTFSLAESMDQAEEYQAAIDAYETVAYRYSEFAESESRNAVESGYAAILMHEKLVEQNQVDANASQLVKEDAVKAWMASEQLFVNNFSDDTRASDVLYQLMQQQFVLAQQAPVESKVQPGFEDKANATDLIFSDYFNKTIKSAERLTAWEPIVELEQQIGAALVTGHSQFTLTEYALAESAYLDVIRLLKNKEKIDKQRIAEIDERLAASIYKQAETALAINDKPLAIEHLLRVVSVTPNTEIRVNAQYDAATYMLELKRWPNAIKQLTDFRNRFPKHGLTAGITSKLALAYSQDEQWSFAATEYLQIWKNDPNNEVKRQALLTAAEYLEKAGDETEALAHYRTYAHSYSQPFDTAMEVRFKMSEFYVASNEDSKRRFWLNKMIQADAEAGEQRTVRSRYLAAMSSAVFANDSRIVFERAKLTLPLKQSLNKKKRALDKAIKAYTQLANYKVAEYSTEASYQIGQIYTVLAVDLMDSERPADLNELELEQYEILLEEQALPFEDTAIAVHETNAKRSWNGVYDKWVTQSFESLSRLMPGRYNKKERVDTEVVYAH